MLDVTAPPSGPIAGNECTPLVVSAAVAAERARIAREMNDIVSAGLLGVELAAASLAAQRGRLDPAALEQRLVELAQLARETVVRARYVLDGLSGEPAADTAPGIASARCGCGAHRGLDPGALIQVVRPLARPRPGLPRPMVGRAGAAGAVAGHPACLLTPREREVMGLIAEGLSNRQIAARLVISEKTVKNHICRIYQRFGVYERSQAVSRWQTVTAANGADLRAAGRRLEPV